MAQSLANWHRFMTRKPDQIGGEGGIAPSVEPTTVSLLCVLRINVVCIRLEE